MKNEMNQAPTTTYTFDDRIVSDLHKDAYGCRPGELFWYQWKTVTDDQKQSIWDNLCVDLDREIARETEAQDRACVRFESRIEQLIGLGAIDRTMAIRWILQAEDLDASEYPPYEELEYRLGLPYRYVASTL